MFRIQTLNKISSVGLQRLPLDNYEVASEFSAPDAILVRSAKMHDMDFPSNLKAIGRAGAGVNNIPLDKCTGQGIVAFNTPGANANAVKELVIASLLLSSRNLVDGINWGKTLIGEGAEVPKLVEKGEGQLCGSGDLWKDYWRNWIGCHRNAGCQCCRSAWDACNWIRSLHFD